jgi:hypothetical protein
MTKRCLATLGVLFLLLTGACTDADKADTTPEIQTFSYDMACEDAGVASEDEIVTDLTPITDWNDHLIREDGPGSRVLVVSWVTAQVASYYLCPEGGCGPDDTCKEGRECPNYRYDSWVTVAPELKDYFGHAMPEPLRIAQLLGLPPGDAGRKAYMLEMYVSPRDLFRPCPDPEITDCQCELDFPQDLFRIFDPAALIYADQNAVNDYVDYRTWFENRTEFIYTAEYPYPWTRLGYTYDWGNPRNPVGLSEFVVHGKQADGEGIAVKINRVLPTQAYFESE